ncbi:MAG: MarR family transcriptional regulator, partial [Nitrososphaeria archaeon]
MSTRIQKLQKIATESIILDILSKQQRVRWKELKQKSGLSSRTLSDRLKGLMDKNLVRRKVDPST